MKKLILLFLTVVSTAAYSQDTIKVMHYNLLYYHKISSYCDESNNSSVLKDTCLKKIIKYVKPDIFTANEINPVYATHQFILNSILNVEGVTHYRTGALSNLSGSDLSNGMFYNFDKLALLAQHNISTSVRDINIYKFYYKAPDLPSTHDTAYLTCIVMHLKAGNDYASQRAAQTSILMNYLNSLNKKANYLLMGDFNIQTSDEQCYQNLINHANSNIRFYDPVNMPGNWNSNYSFKNYHTQSTHDTYSEGCHSTGGMDDRFDFILQSEYIKNGSDHIQYVNGSYKAFGQDGNHYNDSINDGTNNSAPAYIINALYNLSDHLPVVMKLYTGTGVGMAENNSESFGLSFPNPVTDNLHLSLALQSPSQLEITIVNLLGQTVYSCHRETSETHASYEIPVDFLKQGLYFLEISDGMNKPVVRKFIKK